MDRSWRGDVFGTSKQFRRFRLIVENHPNSIGARNDLGLALLMEDRVDEAVQHLSEALRLDPHDLKTHHNLAYAYSFLRRHPEAIQHYRAALRLDPNLPDPVSNIE